MASSFHCTITTTLRRFSCCDGEDAVCTKYKCDSDYFNCLFRVTFYANGNSTENKEHVSIIFSLENEAFDDTNISYSVTFSCTAYVIDSSGNKRFPQSFSFQFVYRLDGYLRIIEEGFGFDKYLKRSTLLSDSSELLPDDSLTICLEIDLEIFESYIVKDSKYDTHGMYHEDGKLYFRMDTEFARDLCKMSNVFQDMVEFSTDEREPNRFKIPEGEFTSFVLVIEYLSEYELSADLPEICDLYNFADKYDMQQIIQLCHQLLISVMRAINTQETLDDVSKNIHLVSELADTFITDESLREILAIYSDIKMKLESGTGELNASNASKLETEWICTHPIENTFVFNKIKSERLEMDMFK